MGTLPVIYWEQAQPGNLGTCGIPMSLYSCWVCANAMNLAKMSHPEANPVYLNGIWTNGNPGYVNGCDGYAGLVPATFGDVTLKRQGYGIDFARGVDINSEAATLGVDATQTLGFPTHFLALDHIEPDGRVICGDPWIGDLCDIIARYGNLTTVDVYTGSIAGGGFLMALSDDQQNQMFGQVNQLFQQLSGADYVNAHGQNAGDLIANTEAWTGAQGQAVYNWQDGTGNAIYYGVEQLEADVNQILDHLGLKRVPVSHDNPEGG
jgi:hypothetical protein